MAYYESVFIARQEVSAQQADALADTFAGVIEENGGQVTKRENWGLKTLAYRIKKNRKGHYLMFNIDGPSQAVQEMERLMGLNADILRILTIRVDELEEEPSAQMQSRSREGRYEDRDRPRRDDRPNRDDKEDGEAKPAPEAAAEDAAKPEAEGEAAAPEAEAKPEADPLPLAGIRVVDLTAFWAGPVAAAYLADMGADVVKVESIQRPDGMRFAGAVPNEEIWEWSPVFHGANPGKRGITLKLDSEEGMALLRRMIEGADVLIENFSARVLENFGLGWDEVRAINPKIIMVRMPAFGLEGPWRDRAGEPAKDSSSKFPWWRWQSISPPSRSWNSTRTGNC